MTHQEKKQYLEEVLEICKHGMDSLKDFKEDSKERHYSFSYIHTRIKQLNEFPPLFRYNLAAIIGERKQPSECETIFIFASLMAEKLLKELQESKLDEGSVVEKIKPFDFTMQQDKDLFTCDFDTKSIEKRALEIYNESQQSMIDKKKENEHFAGIKTINGKEPKEAIMEIANGNKKCKAKRKLKKIKKRLEAAKAYAIEAVADDQQSGEFWKLLNILKIKF